MGMVPLKCPGCGANIELDDSREFGFCNYCGTKVMQEKVVVEHHGSVQIDYSNEIENLYKAARNAKDASDTSTALRHYEAISAKDPNSWEATFYIVVLKAYSIKNKEIGSAAINISNCLPKVFELIKENVNDDQKKESVKEVVDQCIMIAELLNLATKSFYDSATNGTGAISISGMIASNSIKTKVFEIDLNNHLSIAEIMSVCGNCIEQNFDMEDEDYKSDAIRSWKKVINFNDSYKSSRYIELYNNELNNRDKLTSIISKIKKYDPSQDFSEDEKESNSKGCYIATAVYGSYDCPQVWTLRRYRDNQLASTWYGRAFIHTYYAISPTIVKWFGETQWFKFMWKGKLDKMVENLQLKGYESTPYDDLDW